MALFFIKIFACKGAFYITYTYLKNYPARKSSISFFLIVDLGVWRYVDFSEEGAKADLAASLVMEAVFVADFMEGLIYVGNLRHHLH